LEHDDLTQKLSVAADHIRRVLEEMAVVPSAHRARLGVALRLLEEVRAVLAGSPPPAG
jgi:hypothetical protein